MDTNISGLSTTGITVATDLFMGIYAMGGAWATSALAGSMNVMPCAGTVEAFYINFASADTNGFSRTFTIYKTPVATGIGADTGVTVTIPTGSTSAQDVRNTVSFVAGDTLSVHTTAGGTTTTTGTIAWTVRILTAANTSMLLSTSASNISTSVNTYVPIQGNNKDATALNTEAIFPTAGTIKNAYVVLNGTPGANGSGKKYDFTLFQGTGGGAASATAITMTTLETATAAHDTTHSISVSAGDTLYWQCSPTGTPSARTVMISLEFDPTTNGESVHTYGTSSVTNATTAKSNTIASGGQTYTTVGSAARQSRSQTATWKNLYIKHQTAPGTGSSYQYQFYSNNAAGNPSVTISDTATTGSDTTNTASTTAVFTSWVEMQVTPTSNPNTPATSIVEWGIVSSMAIPAVPTFTSTSATNITATSAHLSSTATEQNSNISEWGFVWSTTSDPPTTSDNKLSGGAVSDFGGAFSANLTGLAPGVTYHFRAYAINGIGTGYSGTTSINFVTSGGFWPMLN